MHIIEGIKYIAVVSHIQSCDEDEFNSQLLVENRE